MGPKTQKSPWKENLSQLRSLYDKAYNGVVLIDEQGLIQVYNQTARKLLGISTDDLAVLEYKEITRLGGTKPKHIDFRIIAATNRQHGLMRSQIA